MNPELNKRIVALYQDMIAQLDRVETLHRQQLPSKFAVLFEKPLNIHREKTTGELLLDLLNVCQRFVAYVHTELTVQQAWQVIALLPRFHHHPSLTAAFDRSKCRDTFLHWSL